MIETAPQFEVRLARGKQDIEAAQRLRYDVFVDELGGTGPDVDHSARLERDRFDPHFDHLMLFDHARATDPVVGVYRLLPDQKLAGVGRYYSDSEYDLGPLINSGRRIMELGRSCLHKDYRGGTAMFFLWQGLADYVTRHQIEVMFGVASFHGTDVDDIAQSLSLLSHAHLAPKELRPKSKTYQRMDLIALDQINRPKAMKDVPALIKAYLRLGGAVGDGAFIDHDFNTIDVCLVMDTTKMSARHKSIYTKDRARV